MWATLRAALVNAGLWSACWLLAELARATFFTGFPWIASGYAHAVGPLAAAAPWIGVYGLCALGALVAFAIAAGLRSAPAAVRLAPAAVAALAIAAAHALPGFRRTPSDEAGRFRFTLTRPASPHAGEPAE